ncbi:MAG: HD domain-containing protein [Candidatus Levybacteria bacterium]|nr:HD domain-containing protein [Candidatus Levybacteria bacterium]
MLHFPTTDRDFEEALRFLSDKMPDAKDLPKPTLLHSVRVGVYLYNHGYESTICVAGLLHDLVEDSEVTVKDIAKEFGRDVADIVKANTKNEELPEDIRYDELMKACIQSGENASIVKAADIIDNLTTYRKMQSELGMQNMLRFGSTLLKLRPQEYNDRIFVELEDLLTNN